ncbi:MAG: rane protein [Chitinophagaceae bacterium]|nr:rane protein [Chitinophagaceae bacterium]
MGFMTYELIILCLAAFAAGFIDAIVGGGGLIQTPALFIMLPQYPVATLLGTTKIPSFTGTSIAVYQYSKRVKFDIKLLSIVASLAFAASLCGSRLASMLSNQVFKPIILVLLVGVAIYTYSNKKFGSQSHKIVDQNTAIISGIMFGLLLGFYDGFIGPGSGSFLILAFVTMAGQDFLHASAHAKIVNLSTNLASILYFSSTGHILYEFALPMAACNVAGSFIGAKLALLKGNRFIRIFFLLVITGTIARFAWDIYKGWRL